MSSSALELSSMDSVDSRDDGDRTTRGQRRLQLLSRQTCRELACKNGYEWTSRTKNPDYAEGEDGEQLTNDPKYLQVNNSVPQLLIGKDALEQLEEEAWNATMMMIAHPDMRNRTHVRFSRKQVLAENGLLDDDDDDDVADGDQIAVDESNAAQKTETTATAKASRPQHEPTPDQKVRAQRKAQRDAVMAENARMWRETLVGKINESWARINNLTHTVSPVLTRSSLFARLAALGVSSAMRPYVSDLMVVVTLAIFDGAVEMVWASHRHKLTRDTFRCAAISLQHVLRVLGAPRVTGAHKDHVPIELPSRNADGEVDEPPIELNFVHVVNHSQARVDAEHRMANRARIVAEVVEQAKKKAAAETTTTTTTTTKNEETAVAEPASAITPSPKRRRRAIAVA